MELRDEAAGRRRLEKDVTERDTVNSWRSILVPFVR